MQAGPVRLAPSGFGRNFPRPGGARSQRREALRMGLEIASFPLLLVFDGCQFARLALPWNKHGCDRNRRCDAIFSA